MKNAVFGTILSIGLAVGALTSASAALVNTSPSCSNSGPWSPISPNPVNCIGSFAGDDKSQQADVIPFMSASFVGQTGLGTWQLEETIPALGGGGSFIASVGGAAAGDIDFVKGVKGVFALGFNSGGQFSNYLFDGGTTGIASVYFSTAGTFLDSSGSRVDLDEVSFYSFDAEGGGGTELVPLPASGILLGAGVFGAGLIARYRRARKA